MSARHLAAVPATSRCSPPFLHPSPRPAPLHAKKTSNLALQDNYATIQPCMALGITLEPADWWSRNLFTGQHEGFGRVFSGLTLLYIPHSHLTKFLLREEMVNGLFYTFGLFSLIKQNLKFFRKQNILICSEIITVLLLVSFSISVSHKCRKLGTL